MKSENHDDRLILLTDKQFAATRWSDALSSSGDTHVVGAVQFGTRLVDLTLSRVDVLLILLGWCDGVSVVKA